MERPLKPYQREALSLIVQRRGQAGMFLAPGTGKTIVAIRYAKRLKRVLVVCRRDDYMTWVNELQAEGQPAPFLVKSPKYLYRDWDESFKRTVITYGLVRNKKVAKLIAQSGFNCVIADESHLIKRWKAKQTKSLVKATRSIPRRIAMSGSPITNDLEDIWSQCLFIDDGQTFYPKWWTFMNRYFIRLKPPAPPAWVVKKGAKEEIMARLKRIAVHVHEDDVLTLPQKRYVVKAVEMSSEQKKLYNQLVDEWEYEIASNRDSVEISHVVVRLSKLKQVSGGFLYPPKDSGLPVRRLQSAKLDYLVSMCSRNEPLHDKPKVVIWAAFSEEIRMIQEALGKKRCVVYYGSDRDKKMDARRRFANDPSIKFFVGQADSGVGMNDLVVADTAVYFSNSERVVSRQQSERRIRRIGSERHAAITYYDLLCEGSVDVKVHSSVRQKQETAQSILSAIKLGTPIREALK